jgi:hypothetical protein
MAEPLPAARPGQRSPKCSTGNAETKLELAERVNPMLAFVLMLRCAYLLHPWPDGRKVSTNLNFGGDWAWAFSPAISLVAFIPARR